MQSNKKPSICTCSPLRKVSPIPNCDMIVFLYIWLIISPRITSQIRDRSFRKSAPTSPRPRHTTEKLRLDQQRKIIVGATLDLFTTSTATMSTRNRTPPLLEPYLRLPSEASQLLVTGVLDSSPQWLVTRLLRSAYTPSEETESPEEQDVSVILVSWLRDWEFWKSEARRGAVRHHS